MGGPLTKSRIKLQAGAASGGDHSAPLAGDATIKRKVHRELRCAIVWDFCHASMPIAIGEPLSLSRSPVIRSTRCRSSATLPSLGPGALQIADAPLKPAIAITPPSGLNAA